MAAAFIMSAAQPVEETGSMQRHRPQPAGEVCRTADFSGRLRPGLSGDRASFYVHRSMMIWANSLADSIRSLTFTRSSALCRWVSNPGRVHPKATPPGMPWT